MSEPATYAAYLTPLGTGAIAVVALRGPRAWDVARALFRPAGKLLPETPPAGTVWFGHVGDGSMNDEVVLAVKSAEWLELHCHGGKQVVDWLLQLLRVHGLAIVTSARFLEQAGPAANLLNELARALTSRAAAIILDQVNGAFDAAFADIQSGARSADSVLRRAELGCHLTQPWRVVVAGPPNVGKSSLVNALAGFRRSVVAPAAGTTRDIVSVALAIDGWPVELIDTAGLRESAGGLEAAGIERARAVIRMADLVLWLLDASAAEPPGPDADARTAARILTVANKCDLPAAREMAAHVRVSALTGQGIPTLCAAISRALVPDPPPPGAAVPILPEQLARLRQLSGSE
jgi:tRNA modification GTPase